MTHARTFMRSARHALLTQIWPCYPCCHAGVPPPPNNVAELIADALSRPYKKPSQEAFKAFALTEEAELLLRANPGKADRPRVAWPPHAARDQNEEIGFTFNGLYLARMKQSLTFQQVAQQVGVVAGDNAVMCNMLLASHAWYNTVQHSPATQPGA